jgi:hypothetical protein
VKGECVEILQLHLMWKIEAFKISDGQKLLTEKLFWAYMLILYLLFWSFYNTASTTEIVALN